MTLSFSTHDTVVAVATPPGRGGIGVVRLSGPEALAIACQLTGRETLEPRHATLTQVVQPPEAPARSAPTVVDHVVATYFVSPHSYTGDDVVELSGHGSPPVLQRLVELAMRAGARLAEPGEFTLRAYLNGRLDLVQAEAVADLIDAVTPLQARAAMDQLEGTLTSAIRTVDLALLDLTALLEASLDFPDEGFHFVTRDDGRAALDQIRRDLDRLAADGRAGRVVREGRMVVIAGPPNAGKSSLFNALVGSARAIVAEIPGTTRDAVTERVEIQGVPITLVDTAGLRETDDPVESEGVARTRQAREVAALTLVVLDRSTALPAEVHDVLAAGGPAVVVINKCDRPGAWSPEDLGGSADAAVHVSATTGAGLTGLRERIIGELAGRNDWRDTPAISNVRHLGLIDEARAAVGRAADAISAGATEELIVADLTDARRSLEAITGRRAPDDVLRHIFARFCIGK